jgi:hypothetical protein
MEIQPVTPVRPVFEIKHRRNPDNLWDSLPMESCEYHQDDMHAPSGVFGWGAVIFVVIVVACIAFRR